MSQTYGLSSDSMSSDAVVAGTGAGARDSKERLELESDAEERLELESAAEDEGSWSHQLMVELGCHRGEEYIKAVYYNTHIMFHYKQFNCFPVNVDTLGGNDIFADKCIHKLCGMCSDRFHK